jgi:hypothetical protein
VAQDRHDRFALDFIDEKVWPQSWLHVRRGKVCDFLLQPVRIADANNRKISRLIQAEQQHAPISAVGKRRERLIQPPGVPPRAAFTSTLANSL